ncbi:MAG: hypothetical protein HYY31_01400 [Chloroflexi bacterium]|nr:hypothetical protein [Chloroflexota bacterium]
MVKPLTVTAAPKEQPKPPKAAATVSMQDFKYGVPAKFSAGKTVLQVTNDGKQPHEMSLYRLKGISGDQFLQILSAPPTAGGAPPGPPPFEEAGGFGAVMPGATGWTTLDLTRGDYAMLCFIPDPASGKPHLALGMVYSFKVE